MTIDTEDIIGLLDEASQNIAEIKRRLRHKRRKVRVPHFEEWERKGNNKWFTCVDQFKFVIYRRCGLYHWSIHDRHTKARIASGSRTGLVSPIQARRRIRDWYTSIEGGPWNPH